MIDETFNVTLQIDPGKSVSPDQLFHTTQNLRAEIREIGVQSAELVRMNGAPGGAMSADAFTLGALAIAVLPSVLPALIDFLKDWKLRHDSSSITIKYQRGEQVVEATLPPSISEEQLRKYLDVVTEQLTKDKSKKSK